MHYSESSQAEAGQQIDRLRHMSQPVPSALFVEQPEPLSNPSNSQNFAMGNNDNNDQTSALNDSEEDVLANGQQDSAQPGVPATMFHESHNENSPESSLENVIEANQSNRDQYELDYEESKEPKNDTTEHKNNQERQGIEDMIRPNHQEEFIHEGFMQISEESPYKNSVIRRNEQFSTGEKESSSVDFSKKYSDGDKPKPQNALDSLHSFEKKEERKRTTQPFGYSMSTSKTTNFASFVVPSGFESLAYQSPPPESSGLTSAYLQMNHSRNSESRSSNPHTDSVSSFPVTNYEDSEFMIQAYQRKKKVIFHNLQISYRPTKNANRSTYKSSLSCTWRSKDAKWP